MSKIVCRSQKSRDCYDGKDEERIYGEDGMSTDGTFDGSSVVCDPCYIAIGQPAVDVMSPEASTFGASIEQDNQ